jgi:hypothetical protein
VSAVNIDDFVAVLSQHACPICVVCSARLGGEVLPGVHSALQDAVEQPGLGSTSRHPKKVLPPRRPTDQHHAISTSATRDALRRVPLARALQSCAAAAAIPPIAKPLIRQPAWQSRAPSNAHCRRPPCRRDKGQLGEERQHLFAFLVGHEGQRNAPSYRSSRLGSSVPSVSRSSISVTTSSIQDVTRSQSSRSCLPSARGRMTSIILCKASKVVVSMALMIRAGRWGQGTCRGVGTEGGALAAGARAPVPVESWLSGCTVVVDRTADRQGVSAGARANPSWSGGRRRPTRWNYTLTERRRCCGQAAVGPPPKPCGGLFTSILRPCFCATVSGGFGSVTVRTPSLN